MAQVGVDRFNRVSLTLVVHRGVSAPITQLAVYQRSIKEVTWCVWRTFNDALQHCGRALSHHIVGDNAARRSIYCCDNVGLRFFEPTKVNSSSSSTTSGATTGCLGAGREAW